MRASGVRKRRFLNDIYGERSQLGVFRVQVLMRDCVCGVSGWWKRALMKHSVRVDDDASGVQVLLHYRIIG